jgi:hypothetical protein
MSDFKKYLNVYEFETTLPGSGETVKFKPITTGQMKKLLVYENETDPSMVEGAMDELINSSIVTEEFDVRNVLLQDRFFLLVEIRRKTKGDLYQFEIKCPECGSQSLQTVNLGEMELKEFPAEIDYNVELSENISIELQFVTRFEQMEAFAFVDSMKEEMTDIQKRVEAAMVLNAIAIKSITTPEGKDTEVPIEDKKYLLEEIPRPMYEKVTEWFDKNSFGYDFTFVIDCKHFKPSGKKGVPSEKCGFKQETVIPLENFFF